MLRYIHEIREKRDLLYQEKILCADEEISENIQMQLDRLQATVQVFLKLIHTFYEVTERDGIGNVKSLSALGHREPITIFVKNNIAYGKKSKSLRDSP